MRLQNILQLLAAVRVLRGDWEVCVLIYAKLLQFLLNRLLESRHLGGRNLRVGALRRDGLLVAVLGHKITLSALHQGLLELSGH